MPYIDVDEEGYVAARRGSEVGGQSTVVQDTNTGETYYIGFGPRADELSVDQIKEIARQQGWELPKKFKIYGVPHSLSRDPIRNIKAMAIGRWLASRKNKASKKKTKAKISKKPTKTSARKKTTTNKQRTIRSTRYRMASHLGVQCTDCSNYGRLSTGKMGCKETLVPLTKPMAMRPKDCVFFVPTYIEI